MPSLTAVLGPALTSIPINALRLVIGGLLLVFGLQWLRKAILRAAGVKAQRDESAAYARELESARGAGAVRDGFDGYSFTIAFKGVFLEGLEVVFIVLTFGSGQHRVALAAAAAGVAVLLVTAVGVLVHAPLARAPENAMKFAVGVMLTAYGMFWSVEGAGGSWPGGDAGAAGDHPGDAGGRAGTGLRGQAICGRNGRDGRRARGGAGMTWLDSLLRFLWEFVVGDDWRIAVGVVIALGVTAILAGAGITAWWLMPVAVAGLLAASVLRAASPPGN